MKIVLIGRRNFTGAGVLYSAFCDGLKALAYLDQLTVEVEESDPAGFAAAKAGSSANNINIWFHPHDKMGEFRGINVVWAIFETTRPAESYLAALAPAAFIWTPSAWSRDILIASGVAADQVDVVPEGVDSAVFHPFLRSANRPAGGNFHFLTIGKFEARKSYVELLEAFSAAFAGQPQVKLIIKADYFAAREDRGPLLRALVGRYPKIEGQVRYLSGRYAPEEMAGFYSFADAFVFPSKAEGWGLPLIEAMAAGLPAVTTAVSGQMAYLEGNLDHVTVIDHVMTLIDDADFLRAWPPRAGAPGQWAQPSVDSLSAAMLAVYQDHPARQTRAFALSDRIRAAFDWRNSVTAALASLRRRGLLERDIRFNVDFA